MKWILSLALAVLTAVALAGCAGIPSSGSVHQGAALTASDTSPIEFFPAGPAENATQEQILRGFLEAASGPQNDYAVARQYLSPELQTKWDPNTTVQADSASRSVVMSAGNTASVTTTVYVTLDSTGQFSESKEGVSHTLSYAFTPVNGQWRLSAAPQGVLVDRGIFDLIYRSYPIYFFDPTFRYLVPDVRWFARASSTTTRITKALLAGPAAWLAAGGAVVNTFPAATGLVANAVPVIKDAASIDLTSQASAADSLTLLRMKQQATASLTGVNGVSTVDLFVEGVPAAQNAQAYIDTVLPAPVDTRPFVLTEKGAGYLDGDTLAPAAVFAFGPTSGYSAVTMGTANRYAATLATEGVGLLRPGAGVSVVDARPGLIAPSLDRLNYVWSVPRAAPSDLLAISSEGTTYKVAVPFAASSITALEVSHDGTRVAILYTEGTTNRLIVSTVLRGENGVPVRLGSSTSLALPSGTPIDIAWVDATSVAAIATQGSISTVMTSVIGGRSQSFASFIAGMPASIAGGNNLSQLRILATDGRLYSLRNSATWSLLSTGIKVLAVQQ